MKKDIKECFKKLAKYDWEAYLNEAEKQKKSAQQVWDEGWRSDVFESKTIARICPEIPNPNDIIEAFNKQNG